MPEKEAVVIGPDLIKDILSSQPPAAGTEEYGAQWTSGASPAKKGVGPNANTGRWFVLVQEDRYDNIEHVYGPYATEADLMRDAREIYRGWYSEPECDEYETDEDGDDTDECAEWSHDYPAPADVESLDQMNEYFEYDDIDIRLHSWQTERYRG